MTRVVLLVAALAALVAGVAAARGRPALTVYAAASLTNVFPQIDSHERYSFAGSNTLAAQIEQGAPADVFASADTAIPQQLYARHLVTKPVVFTRNALVLIVPRSNPARVRSVYDLRRKGIRLVVAAPGVPVGDYTAQALRRIHLATVLAHAVSREPDVRSVLAKVALDEADAGFVYSTDARTARGKVVAIRLPARAQPNVRYAVAVVRSSAHREQAQAWVRTLLERRAQAKLVAAGFLPRVAR